MFEERRYTVLWRRGALIALSHAALDLAPDGIYHARELGKEAVASILYDAAAVLFDLGLNQLREVRLQPLVVPSSSASISREYPATSAARIAARRRTGGIACRRKVRLTKSTVKRAPTLPSRWPGGPNVVRHMLRVRRLRTCAACRHDGRWGAVTLTG